MTIAESLHRISADSVVSLTGSCYLTSSRRLFIKTGRTCHSRPKRKVYRAVSGSKRTTVLLFCSASSPVFVQQSGFNICDVTHLVVLRERQRLQLIIKDSTRHWDKRMMDLSHISMPAQWILCRILKVSIVKNPRLGSHLIHHILDLTGSLPRSNDPFGRRVGEPAHKRSLLFSIFLRT